MCTLRLCLSAPRTSFTFLSHRQITRKDDELKDKVIQDSKQLAHPKWKVFFDSIFMLGVLLLLAKIILFASNYFFGTDFLVLEGIPRMLSNFLPLVLMVIGGIGSDQLKDKFV